MHAAQRSEVSIPYCLFTFPQSYILSDTCNKNTQLSVCLSLSVCCTPPSLLRGAADLLFWQWTPSKPGWHLHTYWVKTSPRRLSPVASHTPWFWQGEGLQGPVLRGQGEGGATVNVHHHHEIYCIGCHVGCLTALCLIASVPGEAVRTDADVGGAGAGHTGATVTAHVHLTVVTCTHTPEVSRLKKKPLGSQKWCCWW